MKIQRGDIVDIDGGRHKIICGSCLNDRHNELLERLPIELILTDPPYGVDVMGKKNSIGLGGVKYRPIRGNGNTVLFRRFYEKVVTGCAVEKLVVFGGNYFADILPAQRGWVTWLKHNNEKVSFNRTELIYTNVFKKTDVISYRWSGAVIEPEELEYGVRRTHPTQKPVGLLRRLIEKADVSDEGYILDGFAGSCSLLFAAETLGKSTVLFELDNGYVGEALRIYRERYPEQAITVNGLEV